METSDTRLDRIRDLGHKTTTIAVEVAIVAVIVMLAASFALRMFHYLFP